MTSRCIRFASRTALLAAIGLLSAEAQLSAQVPKEADAAKLTAILGSAPDRWQFSRRQGGAEDYQLLTIDNQPVLSATSNCPVLTRLDPIAGDSEVTIRFRYALPPKTDIWFILTGIKKLEDDGESSPYRMHLSVPAGAETETVNFSLHPRPGQSQPFYGSSRFRSLPASRLTWPAQSRARVEQDAAAVEPLGNRWLTVRYVLRKNAHQTWLDDRLMREASGPTVEPFGMLRLALWEGVQLGSVQVRPLPPDDPRFDPIRLDGYVNGAKIKGDTLRRDSLPGGGKDMKVQGVPFVLPTPGAGGNDHLDLSQSWLRGGLVEGPHDAWEGDTARWRGALYRDGGRIQLRVRNARYRALHLLATFDEQPDATPIVTAQFYRSGAGHPVNITAKVPAFSATAANAVPVQLAGGGKGNLFLVTIPFDSEGLDAFADQDHLEFELTKEVRVYRSYPDPVYYSEHAAGLPSGVHVFAATLERPSVEIECQPDRFAHIWTAPEQPSYSVKLRNVTTSQQDVELELATASHDGSDKTTQKKSASLPSQSELVVTLPLALKRFGYHRVELRVKDADGVRTRSRSLAFLHPDTRERGNWDEGKGPIFGFWDWGGTDTTPGGHLTPGGMNRLRVMAAAGMESSMQSFTYDALYPKDQQAFLESIGAQTFFVAYQLTMGEHSLGGKKWDPSKPAEMQAALIQWLKSQPAAQPSKINRPELAVFFAEPILGPISYMSMPEYYGDPPYQMTADERANFKNHLDQFVTAAQAIKREWPQAKCLMPWGLPTFPVPFLRESKEARDLMDGPAIDIVLFERMPEMQMHQVTYASLMWQLKQEWAKAGKPWPNLATIEGPAVSPARPGSITPQQEADHTVRGFLLLAAYGVTRHLGWPTPFHCAGGWGETHYGGGLCEPMPLLSPRPVYSAYATMTRQLNRMNYVKTVPTGSHSTFCLQFKHYKTGELLHVLWTLRGKRPARVDVPPNSQVTVFDSMDNASMVADHDGKAEFVVTASPCYLRGLSGDAKLSLGEPDHSDARPSTEAVRLGELGDGTWKFSDERDLDYENSHSEFVRRFPNKMSVAPAAAPADRGKALPVHLEKPEKERLTMPFYSTLLPAKPIVLPGKPSHLGLWVRAASDWGRVVYCLRDAQDEKWLSVGKKGEWNVDDIHSWSAFCFDGWRYLRFELPGNAPYDCFREAGTSFWGPYGPGDGVIDLPLTLEKIIVERRTHVIAGTELLPANGEDVVLGSLFAEYERPADQTDEAIRLSRLRMPAPPVGP